VWEDRDPEAAARLKTARARIAEIAERLGMPTENVLTPDHLRRIAWRPPERLDADSLAEALRGLGAREWQIAQVLPDLLAALADPEPLPVRAKGSSADR
jgi:ribonuclease D